MSVNINVPISDESHAAWKRYADDRGISLAVLFEVLPQHLHAGLRVDAERRMVAEARAETARRRRAGGPRKRQPPPDDDPHQESHQ